MALERFPRESPSHSVCGRYRYGQGCGLSVFHLGVQRAYRQCHRTVRRMEPWRPRRDDDREHGRQTTSFIDG